MDLLERPRRRDVGGESPGGASDDVLAQARAEGEAQRRVAADALGRTTASERRDYLRQARNRGAQ